MERRVGGGDGESDNLLGSSHMFQLCEIRWWREMQEMEIENMSVIHKDVIKLSLVAVSASTRILHAIERVTY